MMKTNSQALVNSIGSTFYLLALWLLTVIATQLLGYEAVGDLTLAMSIGNIIILFQLYGVRGFQSSDINFKYIPKLYLKARFYTVGIGILIGVLITFLLGYSMDLFFTIFLFILFRSSEALSDVLFGDDQRFGKLEFAGYSMLLRGIITSLLFITGAYIFKNLNLSLLLIVIGSLLLTVLLDYPLYRKTIVNYERKLIGNVDSVFRDCFPLLITTLIPAVINAVPRIALAHWYGNDLLGYYGNVSTPTLVLITLIPNILIAYLPKYGKMVALGDFQGVAKLCYQSICFVIIISLIYLLIIWLIGRPILAFFYTKRILLYFHFLYYVLFAMAIYSIEICCSTALVAMRENRVLQVSAFCSLFICLFTSIPLVKSYGIGGAIGVLVISYAVQVFIQIIHLNRMCL